MSKASYFSKLFNEVKSLSAYWKLVKGATSSRVGKQRKGWPVNSFFANIGKNITAKLPTPPGNATTGAYRSDLCDTSPPATISNWDLSTERNAGRSKIKDLKSNKSSGPDNLTPKLLQLAGDDIVPSMYRLFNTSIESESLYSSWKIAKPHTDL